MKGKSSAFMGILVLVIAVGVVGTIVYMGGGTYTTLGEAAKTQPITLPICEPNYICKSNNERCYQNERCRLSQCITCAHGCTNGVCNPAPCTAQWICNGSNKCYQNSDCSVTNCTACTYGCTSGICDAAPLLACNTGETCRWASEDCVTFGQIATGAQCNYILNNVTKVGYCCKNPTCTAGYVCNGSNKCYQNSDCSVTNCTACTYGCTSGVCNPPSCSDSDGGIYIGVVGNVTYNNTVYSDYCITNSSLREYYCTNNSVPAYQDYNCLSYNYTYCSDGRCN